MAPVTEASSSDGVAGTVAISPIVLDLMVPTETRVGDEMKLRAAIRNVDDVDVLHVVVVLRVSSAGLGVRGGLTRIIQRVRPDRTGAAVWQVCATEPGTYVLLASATVGDVTTDSPARLLVVTPNSGRCR